MDGLIDLIGDCYRIDLAEPEWLEQLARSAARALGSCAEARALVCRGAQAPRRPLSWTGQGYLLDGRDEVGDGVVLGAARTKRLPASHEALLARTAAHLASGWRLRAAFGRDTGSLTRREEEVLAHAAQGRHNKLIAYDLGLAHSTVRVLLHRAASKLGANGRAEAVRLFQLKRAV